MSRNSGAIVLALILGTAVASVGNAQTQELIERGMKENNSGRTAAKVFKERARKLDRTPEIEWETQDGYLGTAEVEQLAGGEMRICTSPRSAVLESKRATIGRDDQCWRVQGKRKPTVTFVFGRSDHAPQTSERRVRCKIRGAGTLGFFDVHVLEKEVIHKGHCTFRD